MYLGIKTLPSGAHELGVKDVVYPKERGRLQE
jgi:hypothetical protein